MSSEARSSRPSESEPFILAWRRAVTQSDLPSSARLVLHTLSTHMNSDGSGCRIGTRRLTSESGLARNTVLSALSKCESAGWVTVIQGSGRATNQYEPSIPSGATSEPQAASSGAVAEPLAAGSNLVVARFESRSGAIRSRSGAVVAPKDVEDEQEDENTLAFETFWRDYPRKLAKRVVRQKFVLALKRTDSTTLLEGAAKWCAYWREADTEERFIPHPTTWLNRDDWERDPPALRRHQADRAAARVAAALAYGPGDWELEPPEAAEW